MNRPRLVLTELREYRSERTGNTYFSGYLGKARVVMLRDERAECTGKEVARWNVLLEEPEPCEARTGGATNAGAPPRRSEPHRVSWRLFGLDQAAKAWTSAWA